MSILGVPPNRMVKLDRSDLDHFGKMLIRFILEEIKKDAMLSTNIPDTRDFYDSFGYKIDGNNVVIMALD